MTRRILSNTTALGFVIAIVASTTAAVDKNWLTHFYGRVKADSYEYFVVDVPRGVFAVDVSMVLSELGARTPPTLFLQKDAFATESSYDVALNTTRKSPYISATLTNLKHGRYYATVWGGNMPGTVTTFGVGPSTNMWWYLDFTFRACQHVDMLGPACTTASVALPSRQQHGYSGSNDADGRGCIDSTPALFSFELAQPAASLDVTLSIQDPSILVGWALYLDTATPFPSDALPVRNGTSATRSFHIPRPQTGKWMVRVALPQPAETIGKCNPNIDQPTGGIPFTVSWNTTETCDPLDGDLCAASWTPLNQLRNAANPLDDYVVDASFSSNQPLKPSMNVSNVVVRKVAYDVQVEPVYAGTNVVLHMATTALVSNFSVFIRVNGWPTLTEYDYTYVFTNVNTCDEMRVYLNDNVFSFHFVKRLIYVYNL
ncbi:hypothetical protein AaE_005972 [Aphanomyces astaci]|uniref:Uncharacterized protein n=1 Tax=Aphanomyces astaci TaxID=112090 RepID=A0A6A5AII8_APHAT|nr:hypothetical protein AaE_005972 [Aphanomyces astaci]